MIEETRAKYTANKINKLSGKTILDIGCGEKLIKKYLNHDKKYIGVDIKNKPHIRANIMKLPFKNNTFDIINLSQILEHLDNPITALKECKRILTDNGSIFIDVPNPLSFDNFIEWLIRKKSLSSCEHLSSFGIAEIYNISKQSNLKCEYLETRFFFIPTFSRFKRILIPIKTRLGGYNYFRLSKT